MQNKWIKMAKLVWVSPLFFLGCQQNVADECSPVDAIVCYADYVDDSKRDRTIPITVYNRPNKSNSEVVILSAGYGCSSTEYTYLAQPLAEAGYLVLAVQHELATDPILPGGDDLFNKRLPFWEEGKLSVQAVKAYGAKNFENYDFNAVHLIGHSNGGDISVLFAESFPEQTKSCTTLDHRRVPMICLGTFKSLSFRGNDFEADPGVIPPQTEHERCKIKIVELDAGHNYLRDNATKEIKAIIVSELLTFLKAD